MNQVAIALSVILSFLCTEFLGLATGGMISAGYLSLFLQSPARLVCTLGCAVLVYLLVLLLQKFVIIYGRRRFMACVLLGFIFTWIWGLVSQSIVLTADVRIVGFIIPGLIANDMLKQGVVKTVLALAVLTVLTHLLYLLAVVVL